MMRLALHGGLFSGKSTLAKSLVERGFVLVNYTDYLKKLYVRSLNAIGVELTLADVFDRKEAERPHIISLGTRIGFDKGNYVEQCLAEEASDIGQPAGNTDRYGRVMDGLAPHIVFDNIRFLPQYERLKEYGFILVRLTTPYRVRERRALYAGCDPEAFYRRTQDPSERALPTIPDEVQVSVDGDMQQVLNHLTAQLLARETGLRESSTIFAPVASPPPASPISTPSTHPILVDPNALTLRPPGHNEHNERNEHND